MERFDKARRKKKTKHCGVLHHSCAHFCSQSVVSDPCFSEKSKGTLGQMQSLLERYSWTVLTVPVAYGGSSGTMCTYSPSGTTYQAMLLWEGWAPQIL